MTAKKNYLLFPSPLPFFLQFYLPLHTTIPENSIEEAENRMVGFTLSMETDILHYEFM
jgi:hypothetical protein